METIDGICLSTRDEWRSWLEKNHATKRSVWLIYHKKGSARPSIPYEDSVEEAICYGWIDGSIRRIDDETYARKFTRRNKTSRWSETNIRRASKMVGLGKMTGAGLLKYNERLTYEHAAPECYDDHTPVLPPDLLTALKSIDGALDTFNSFSPSYRRLSVLWINDAKRDATRMKRIGEIAGLAAENKKKRWM